MILVAAGRGMDQRIALRDQLVQGDGRRRDAAAAAHGARRHLARCRRSTTYLRGADGQAFPVVDEAGRVVGTVSIESARRSARRDPTRPVRDGMRPLTQTPVVAPDETLDEALEWLGGRDGLVLRDGVARRALSVRTTSSAGTGG